MSDRLYNIGMDSVFSSNKKLFILSDQLYYCDYEFVLRKSYSSSIESFLLKQRNLIEIEESKDFRNRGSKNLLDSIFNAYEIDLLLESLIKEVIRICNYDNDLAFDKSSVFKVFTSYLDSKSKSDESFYYWILVSIRDDFANAFIIINKQKHALFFGKKNNEIIGEASYFTYESNV